MFSRRKPSAPRPICPNVITPDKIPTFFIPPNLATLQGRRSIRCASPEANSGSARGHADPVEGSKPLGSPTDGHLQNASSMPQLSGPLGLPLLPESPHTRRRESLFHGGQVLWRCHFSRFSAPPTGPLRHRGLVPDSDTVSSTETSPYSSPLPTRSPASPVLCHDYRQRRRLASCSSNLNPRPRPSSLSMEETSSADTSPIFPRRETDLPWELPATIPAFSPTFPLDSVRCRERLSKEVVLTVSQGGRLRLSSEYLQAQGCLRIRLVSAEAFYPSHCDPRHIHCCISLHLRPRAGHRQRSAIVKKSRNPIFNEDFFFEGVSPEEIARLSLRLKVLNKSSAMRRDAVLGECDVPLDSLLP